MTGKKELGDSGIASRGDGCAETETRGDRGKSAEMSLGTSLGCGAALGAADTSVRATQSDAGGKRVSR